MDDLSQKIDSLLQSPEGMQKIQAAMAALGASAPSSETDAPPPEPAEDDMLSRLLGGLAAPTAPPKAEENTSGGLPDIGKLLQLMPLLSGLNKDDENTALLKALRPHLHGEREKRVDDALQMMKLMKLMPFLADWKGGSS